MNDPPIEYLNVWQNCPPDLQESVKRLWSALGVLTDQTEAERRLAQLCCLAIEERDTDRLVGVSTAQLATYEPLRASFFFFRCLVVPEARRHGVARELTVRCRDILSDWSAANPASGAMGMATVVESPLLSDLSRHPVWPASGLTLIGYTPSHQQIRAVWFPHARLGFETPST